MPLPLELVHSAPVPPPSDPLEDDFAAALTDPERSRPEGLTGPNGKQAAKRFDVYRNNVVSSLIGVLADIFPAVERIVGPRFFRSLARVHVLEEPPTSRLMTEYGRGFPGFVARFEHTQSMPYLADVARIERAWLDSYHAADAAPLDPAELGAVPPERLGEVRFVPHPAMQVLRSKFSATSVFAMNRGDGSVAPIDWRQPEDALVVRPALDVNVIAPPPGGAAFLLALAEGKPLGVAAAMATEEAGETFDLAANIGGLLQAGAFTAIELDN